MAPRLTPFEMVFGDQADDRFAVVAQGLADAGRDPRDREAFILVREVVELLRELAPVSGPEIDEGVGELVAFLHASYLYWADGRCRVRVERDTLDRTLAPHRVAQPVAASIGRSYYLELPVQRVWGVAVEGEAPEPLDGGFVIPRDGRLDMVAIFGLHPNRDGFTVVDVSGPRLPRLARADLSPLFSATFEGGRAAGLFQVVGNLELLELGYRINDLVGQGGAMPGTATVAVV